MLLLVQFDPGCRQNAPSRLTIRVNLCLLHCRTLKQPALAKRRSPPILGKPKGVRQPRTAAGPRRMLRLSRRAVTGIVKEAFQVEARDRAGLDTAHAASYKREGVRCGRRNYDCEPASWLVTRATWCIPANISQTQRTGGTLCCSCARKRWKAKVQRYKYIIDVPYCTYKREGFLKLISASRRFPGMPFPEPETALAATIAAADEGNPILDKMARS